eukprot:1160745-Pelagomonas_calceolata.AAC.5
MAKQVMERFTGMLAKGFQGRLARNEPEEYRHSSPTPQGLQCAGVQRAKAKRIRRLILAACMKSCSDCAMSQEQLGWLHGSHSLWFDLTGPTCIVVGWHILWIIWQQRALGKGNEPARAFGHAVTCNGPWST